MVEDQQRPIAVAGELWQKTRLDGPRGGRVEALLSPGMFDSLHGVAAAADPRSAD
jgi:hypothetical protein